MTTLIVLRVAVALVVVVGLAYWLAKGLDSVASLLDDSEI